MAEWQTIDTAPKDRTHLLGWWGGKVMAVFYLDAAGNPYDHEGVDYFTEPTHWMPLPPSPAIAAAPKLAGRSDA